MSSTPLVTMASMGCAYYVRRGRLGVREHQALADITLTVNKGETLGIIGANGAGKSTLLQVMARILTPSSGSIEFAGTPRISLLKLMLGFSPLLSGRDNAILNALLLGYTRAETNARLGRIFDFAELGDAINDPLRTYSTGMQARLGFAVAMEMSPDILLIDEVFAVGDEYFQKKSSNALMEKMRSGQTTVLVSHSAPTMKNLCTRVAWIDKGRTVLVGEPGPVLDAYHEWVKQRSETRAAT